MQTLRLLLARGQENTRRALAELRAVLTEEQWEMLPQGFRAGPAGQGGGAGPRPGPGERRPPQD